jgi:hypothetical protein
MTLVIDGRTVQRVVLLDREPDEPKTAALADEVRVGAVISRYLADPLVTLWRREARSAASLDGEAARAIRPQPPGDRVASLIAPVQPFGVV